MRKMAQGHLCDGCRGPIDPREALRQGRADTTRLFHGPDCAHAYVSTREEYKALDAQTYYEIRQLARGHK